MHVRSIDTCACRVYIPPSTSVFRIYVYIGMCLVLVVEHSAAVYVRIIQTIFCSHPLAERTLTRHRAIRRTRSRATDRTLQTLAAKHREKTPLELPGVRLP